MTPIEELKALLRAKDMAFWSKLAARSAEITGLDEVLFLAKLRKAGDASMARAATPVRIALLGGCSWHPLREAVEHMVRMGGFGPELFVGEFDNYNAEIREDGSPLYAFRPDVLVLLPAEGRCTYPGAITDAAPRVREAAVLCAQEILALCERAHERSGCEVILGNFIPPSRFDPGPYRVKALASDWSFRRLVNLELGAQAPSYVHVCDVDFLASRRGLVTSRYERGWFESKQPFATDLQVDVARELAHIVLSLRATPAKVLAVDLDNTLWGGVIGDDGIEGIEIGDTSPRGEAFKAFQREVLSLHRRGVLLAVCSKNDHDKAVEPFAKHPEMVLRMHHFAAFYANWNPKSDNLRAIASDLDLGLDSIVFVDDNPAEIDIVKQFAPEVRTVLLGPDPALYAGVLADCRFFEPLAITPEDMVRGDQYGREKERKALKASVTDMDAYLDSLEMKAHILSFTALDLPRITQLINKSNQFNLTTIRRTETEVLQIKDDSRRPARIARLADRFGEHGLISVLITEIKAERPADLEIETWVMSCRVLKRQVEEELANEVFRIAREHGCARVIARYRKTAKNSLVADLYPRLGFSALESDEGGATYVRDVESYQPFRTKIAVCREMP